MRFAARTQRRIVQFFAAMILMGALGGCASTVYVPSPPPAPRAEVRAPRPGPRYVWQDGHWKWTGRQYVWVKGHWVKGRKQGVWVKGHWVKRPRGWVYVPGHWK